MNEYEVLIIGMILAVALIVHIQNKRDKDGDDEGDDRK
jgi:hypothetical protein